MRAIAVVPFVACALAAGCSSTEHPPVSTFGGPTTGGVGAGAGRGGATDGGAADAASDAGRDASSPSVDAAGTDAAVTTCAPGCAGCCDLNAVCQPGNVNGQCGIGGAQCQVCSATTTCTNGQCL